jgi:hypothetical protein
MNRTDDMAEGVSERRGARARGDTRTGRITGRGTSVKRRDGITHPPLAGRRHCLTLRTHRRTIRRMPLPFAPALLQVPIVRDTIVALTVPPERTLFDWTSGVLQIVALLAGTAALIAMAASALALRRAVTVLQGTADRLATDAQPLLHQATRAAEDARDVVKLVRAETEKLAGATGAVSARVLEVTEAAADRLDQMHALLDVLQDEVEDTALSAAATVRGLRVGAAALGAALGGRRRRRDDADASDVMADGEDDDADAPPADDDGDAPDEDAERPYFGASDDGDAVDDADELEERPRRRRSGSRRRRG